MSTPDPTTVREIAAKVANIALHDSVHVDQWISAVIDSDFGNECSQVRAPLHAAVARRMATVRPSWPDEQQLAAVTARTEKAEALVAGFGPACCVCGRILGYRNYRDQLFCWPCADGEPKTADAAPGGLSGPVERPEASGGSFQANTSSILPQGLSEAEPPRDTSAWCWAPNPNGPLCCERLRDHEPPHRRGERTWTDDTTEDGQ